MMRLDVRFWSETGAANLRQMPSGAASRIQLLPLTCTAVSGRQGRTDGCLVRDEEALSSIPGLDNLAAEFDRSMAAS